MGWTYRKRAKLGDGLFANLSTRGASVSKKIGRVTVNSRGRGSINFGKGLSFRFGKRR